MFGEEKMFGQTEVSVDEKNRFVLPLFTKREQGDNLVLVEDNDLNIFRIYHIDAIEKMFDQINEKLKSSKTDEERKINKKNKRKKQKNII